MNNFRFSLTLLISLVGMQGPLLAQENADLKTEITPEVARPKNIFPTSVLARPFTMPKNSFETKIKLKAGSHGINDNSLYSLSSLSVAYGITDDFEFGLSWDGLKVSSLTFDNAQPSKSLSVNLGYFLFGTPYAAGMISLSVPFHFDGEVIKTTSLALPTSLSMIRRTLAFMILHEDLVVMNWRKNFEVEFNFPIKLNYQATNHFIVDLSTHLGKLSTQGNHRHIGMASPLHLGALYAINNTFDIAAKIGFDDVQQWRDTFSVVAGIAYRFGPIDG